VANVNVSAGNIRVRFYVRLSELDLMDIQFPFPLLTESGLTIRTEEDGDISIDGGSIVAIPLVGGIVPPQQLHVILED